MAKVLKKKTSKDIDWTKYAEGDPLFDLLRSYYISTGEMNSSKWVDMCKNDMEHQRTMRKKKINDKRNYGK